ncbi:TPA: transposase [Aeromonas veronii]
MVPPRPSRTTGSQPALTDQTISTFLMLKGIFNLTLRATEGLLDSLFELMNAPLCAPPDYSCVSKLGRVYMDGAYDSKASRQLISHKGATACIPSRKNAGLWKKGHTKNEAVLVMRKEGLVHWK